MINSKPPEATLASSMLTELKFFPCRLFVPHKVCSSLHAFERVYSDPIVLNRNHKKNAYSCSVRCSHPKMGAPHLCLPEAQGKSSRNTLGTQRPAVDAHLSQVPGAGRPRIHRCSLLHHGGFWISNCSFQNCLWPWHCLAQVLEDSPCLHVRLLSFCFPEDVKKTTQ